MTDDTHPSLEDYPVDDDYCDVDNRSPTSEQARDAQAETSDDNQQVSDTPPPDDRRLPRVDYDHSYLLYQGQSSESTRQKDMLVNIISPTAHDGRALTRTYWRQQDVPDEKKQQYSRMMQYQEGMWESDRKTQNKQADNRRALDTFASRLDCTQHQEDVAEAIIDSVDLSELGPYSHRDSILAALSIATFIEDQRDVKGTEGYRMILDDIDTTPKQLRNVRTLLRKKSTYLN